MWASAQGFAEAGTSLWTIQKHDWTEERPKSGPNKWTETWTEKWTEEWTEKWKEAAKILDEHKALALKQTGSSIYILTLF